LITKNTVFILGAGASKPYGFPTGKDLKKQICLEFIHLLKNECNKRAQFANDQYLVYLAPAEKMISHFSKTPIEISIDKFININSEYKNIGVSAIIRMIHNAEIYSNLPNINNNNDLDWYSNIFSRMSDRISLHNDFTKFSENKVTFITFNYDRSLEQFIYNSLTNLFPNQNRHTIANEINKINIIHIYGKIGYLPWQKGYVEDNDNYAFDKNNIILKYGDNIKGIWDFAFQQPSPINVIYEERLNTNDINEAKLAIHNAEQIIFLGFGFDNKNLEILGMPQIMNKQIGNRIYGTAYEATTNECNNVRNILYPGANPYIPPTIVNQDCLSLLRNFLD